MLVEWVSFHLLLMAFSLVFCEPTVQCPSCLTMVHRFHLSVSACYTPDDISLGYLPWVTFTQFFFFDFPLKHTGQSTFPHSLISVGDFIHSMFFIGVPPCSTILGFTLPLLCSITSAAIFLQIVARLLFGVAGQKIGNVL